MSEQVLLGLGLGIAAGIFFGDASRAEMLEKFGADRAAALVVTMDSPHTAEHVVATARRHWPELVIYARARDRGGDGGES